MTIKFKALNWKEVLADCLMNCTDRWLDIANNLSMMEDDAERENYMSSLEIFGYTVVAVSDFEALFKIDTEYTYLFIEK